ncbi:MAG TPA: hypothetical protein VFV37_10250 [Luteibaculaceae bacterium]|nr:hypothetical protein [Luteibaculaceae bacterium]
MNRFFSIFLWVIALGGSSCSRDTDNQIPFVGVNVEININNPQYINLNRVGGSALAQGGIRGLILFRSSQEQVVAYDRQSPYQIDQGCTLTIDSSEIYALDTCSQSKFLLFDGTPTEGPATRPLIAYQTSFDGTIVRVFN